MQEGDETISVLLALSTCLSRQEDHELKLNLSHQKSPDDPKGLSFLSAWKVQ